MDNVVCPECGEPITPSDWYVFSGGPPDPAVWARDWTCTNPVCDEGTVEIEYKHVSPWGGDVENFLKNQDG